MSEKGIDENEFMNHKFGCNPLNCENSQCDILHSSFFSQCTYHHCPFIHWINVYHEIQQKRKG